MAHRHTNSVQEELHRMVTQSKRVRNLHWGKKLTSVCVECIVR